MSEKTPNPSSEPILPPESQHERWLKYGGNVVLTAILLIGIAVFVIYLAQRNDKRIDTTAGGENSLSPQTRHVLDGLDSPIKVVSLYSRPRGQSAGQQSVDRAQRVMDLLDEYRRYGKEVSVESIDPSAEPAKVDDLAAELENRYGKEIKDYRGVLSDFLGSGYDSLSAMLKAESTITKDLPMDKLPDSDDGVLIHTAIGTIAELPQIALRNKEIIASRFGIKHPDYAGLTQALGASMDDISQNAGKMAEVFPRLSKIKGLAPDLAAYLANSADRWKKIQKLADDFQARTGKLPELKVTELTDALASPNPILVLGNNGWRLVSEAQVWPDNPASHTPATASVQPRFAGEQLVTTAIYSLSQKSKPAVVFVRQNGEPLACEPIENQRRAGRFLELADRLKEYNFDVVEKDLSGTYAAMAQMQGQPTDPEATDQQMEQAVWIVLVTQLIPTRGGEPPPISDKLAAHLAHGGSALIVEDCPNPAYPMLPPPEDLSFALVPFGIELHNNMVAVHEAVPPSEGASEDMISRAERMPLLFILKDYGPSDLARPLQNLDSLMFPLMVVETHPAAGVTVQPLLPVPTVPQAPRSWGDADIPGLRNGLPTFDPTRDKDGPVFGGAVAEKPNGARLVVVGCPFFENQALEVVDPDLAAQNIYRPLFPGNAELAMNSVFWLSHLDSMISISPADAQLVRIGNMSHSTLVGWRIFILLVMPLGAMATGLGVYFRRHN